MTGDCHVQFGERLVGKFHRPTHLDLVQTIPGPIGNVVNSIRDTLAWLGDFSWKQANHSMHLFYKFSPEAAPDSILKVKIEINTREHQSLYRIKNYPFELNNDWYKAHADIASFEPEELFGTKLRALLQRRKSRDLFDLNEGLKQLSLDCDKLVTCFQHYLSLQAQSISRAAAEQRMLEKLQHSLAEDIAPLLSAGTTFSDNEALAAFGRIWFKLITLIPGDSWKLSEEVINDLRKTKIPNLLR